MRWRQDWGELRRRRGRQRLGRCCEYQRSNGQHSAGDKLRKIVGSHSRPPFVSLGNLSIRSSRRHGRAASAARQEGFAERCLWNIARGCLDQSALAPENFTTLAHFSVSSARSLLNSAGEPASTAPPMSARRALILGSARPASIAWLSLSTISTGVFLGAPMPNTKLASYTCTKSRTVGMSCNTSERVAPVTANARNLPPLM